MGRSHLISHPSGVIKQFNKKNNEKTVETVGCFGRILFKGHLPISSPSGMANFMRERGVLFKDFGKFVQKPAQDPKQHTIDIARTTNRPYEYVNSKHIRKEELARKIAERDGIPEGLVCIHAAIRLPPSLRRTVSPCRPG